MNSRDIAFCCSCPQGGEKKKTDKVERKALLFFFFLVVVVYIYVGVKHRIGLRSAVDSSANSNRNAKSHFFVCFDGFSPRVIAKTNNNNINEKG